jgi:hypothetical protein
MKPAHLVVLCIVVPEEALRTRIDRDIPQRHIGDQDPLDRLKEAAKGSRNTRTWPRVQAILQAKQGDSASQVARALGVSRCAVQAWVTAHDRGGLDACPTDLTPAARPSCRATRRPLPRADLRTLPTAPNRFVTYRRTPPYEPRYPRSASRR